MTEQPIFTKKTVISLSVIGVLAFVGMILAVNFSQNLSSAQKSGTTTLSKSAIGHNAFFEFLMRAGFNVSVSRHRSSAKAESNSVLLLMEPAGMHELSQTKHWLANKIVLVLPKWHGAQDPKKPSWITKATLIKQDHIRVTLKSFEDFEAFKNLMVNRVSGPTSFEPEGWSDIEINQLQLVNSPDITPIINAPEGILVGRIKVDNLDMLLISDPDILSNHGIGKANHAHILEQLFSYFTAGKEQLIVLDETIHGLRLDPNLMKMLLKMPFLITTLIAILAITVLIWATIGRFGSPNRIEPQFKTGKNDLIDNTAELFLYGNHSNESFSSYHNAIRMDVAHRLKAPPSLDHGSLTEWLGRVGSALGSSNDYRTLFREADDLRSSLKTNPKKILITAQRLNSWRKEVIHGSSRN